MKRKLPDCTCDDPEVHCKIHSLTKRNNTLTQARRWMREGEIPKAEYEAWRAKWAGVQGAAWRNKF